MSDEWSTSSDDNNIENFETIESWVVGKIQSWRDYYDSVYKNDFEEYYRIWRGEWAVEDRTRSSERSRLVTPGTMQAVEECAAEVEEATFTGPLFDIYDDVADNEKTDIMQLKKLLKEDMAKQKVNSGISESILNGAVYGTGIAEIVMDEVIEQKPAVKPMMGGQAVQVGVERRERTVVKLRPILPQNFLIDPNGTDVDNALGVCIDEFVGSEVVLQAQEKGIYDDDVYCGSAASDSELEPTQDMTVYDEDRIRLQRYYGLVPRHLLEASEIDTETEELATLVAEGVEGADEESYYVEAIVVLGNGKLLKAERNPYMMQDRPVVAFQWDNVPGRFFGRGVVEKAYNSQKAVDAEIRARIDALALTNAPMMAIDATRMPRGAKPTIKPGKMIKTNGNPAEILSPFNFGQVQQITFEQANSLQKMLQQATGAVNSSGMPGDAAAGGAKTGAIAMALGSVMKRHKRTLNGFQSCFLIPMVEKMAHRYMQFDPETYPVGDYKFHAEGSLGLIGREYEVSQLSQLLSTMPPDSPLYPQLVDSIIGNMAITNREELQMAMKKASEPNEQEQQQQQQMHEAEMATKQATLGVLQAEANKSNASAQYDQAKAANIPMENEIDMAKVAANNFSPDDGKDVEFERRLVLLDEIRKDRELSIKEKKAESDMKLAEQSATEADALSRMMTDG